MSASDILLTTDRQSVIYCSTIHALELIYFDSYKQETMKKAVVSFRFFQLSAIALKNPANIFDCNTDVYMYFSFIMRKNDITPSNVQETWMMGRMTS